MDVLPKNRTWKVPFEYDNHDLRTMFTLITSLIATSTTILVGLFLSPYIVRTLGAEANGFTQLASNFINYATLITIALNSMAGRFISISYYKNEMKACNEYYSSVIVGNFLIFLFLVLPSGYFIVRLDQIIHIDTANIMHVKYLFAFVFANFFVSQITSILNIASYVKNTQYLQNTVNSAKTILNAVLLLVAFSIFPPKIYIVSLTGILLTIISVPVFYKIKKQVLPELTFKIQYFNLRAVAQLVTSGIWNTINQCGHILMTGLDLLMSNLFINPIQMGVLAVAKIIPNIIIMIAQSINGSFSSNLTISYADASKSKILNSLRYAMKCSNILVSIPIMVMCIYGESFYKLWVPSLEAHNLSILSILTCMAYIPFAGTQVLYNVFTTTNKLKVNSSTFLIGGALNFVAVLFLLRTTTLGLVAVAGISSIISILRNLIITIPYIAKLLNLKWYTFYADVALSLLCCALNGIVCALSQWLIIPSNWPGIIASVSFACLICLILCTAVLLNKEEKNQLIIKTKSMILKNGTN